MRTVELKVEGMTCSHCAYTVEEAIEATGGKGTANVEAGTATVVFDESTVSLSAIQAAIQEEGYSVVG